MVIIGTCVIFFFLVLVDIINYVVEFGGGFRVFFSIVRLGSY